MQDNGQDRDDGVRERLAFYDFDGLDERMLPHVSSAVGRHAGKALDRLYAQVRANPAARAFFASDSAIEAARGKQSEHWRQLFSRRPDQALARQADEVGRVHARIGLAPTWYVGGYALVIEQLARSMAESASLLGRLFPNRAVRTLGTLVKVALMDMDFALTAYFREEEAQRRKVIETLGTAMADMANGRLDQPLPELPAAYASLAGDFETMRVRLGQTLAAASDASAEIQGGAGLISQATDDLARRTEQQAASLEETAAAMNQLTGSVRQTADGAAQVNASVQEAQANAAEGGRVVREAETAMSDIERSAAEIGKITEVIDGIAFQTNLLALNAGVEAARAGESGKGFAVVATEVRALAQRTADAARDIKALIVGSSEQVKRGVMLVGETGTALDRIAHQVEGIATLASSIRSATEAQANSVQQVNSAVGEMDQVTQRNAAMVEESLASVRALAARADELDGIVQQYRGEASVGGMGGRMRRAA